jgi:hypothetical protein
MILTKPLALIFFLPLLFSINLPEKTGGYSSVEAGSSRLDSISSLYYSLIRSNVPKPDYEVFRKAFTGFLDLKAENKLKKNILTIIDFSRSCNRERMWIIDLAKMEIVHLTLVAHGKNSGLEFASRFSNIPASLQSSIGFFVTGEIFNSNHGMSLMLDGAEPGINDNARQRGIIIHGATYVSKEFIGKYGILGRSFGCPAIPMEDHERVINLLSGKSCIYIHYPDPHYEAVSRLIKTVNVIQGMSILSSEITGSFSSGVF